MATATTKHGVVRGKVEPFVVGAGDEAKHVEGTAFRGIRYATAKRWGKPEEPPIWLGVKDAFAFGPGAPQPMEAGAGIFSMIGGALGKAEPAPTVAAFNDKEASEDCLCVNIYTPTLKPTKPMPVMFWIHGGGLLVGMADTYEFPGAFVSQDMVLVTINYRMGALGYFAHPDLGGTTNFGLLDQIAALKWVRDNICNFGGDPGNVTIFGESAGGLSVAALLLSPLASGLFHRAILQSAGFYTWASSKPLAEGCKEGVALGESLGCPAGPKQLEQMLNVPLEKFGQLSGAWMAELWDAPFYGLYVDGKSCMSSVLEGFKSAAPAVPIMIGATRDEADLFGMVNIPLSGLKPVTTVAGFQAALTEHLGPRALDIFQIKEAQEIETASKDIFSQCEMGAFSFAIAKTAAANGGQVYLYNFAQPHGKVGAFHGSEIPFVFGVGVPNFIEQSQELVKWDVEYSPALAAKVNAYVTAFAKTGDPNAAPGSSLPRWKPFGDAFDEWMELSEGLGMKPITPKLLSAYELACARIERLTNI